MATVEIRNMKLIAYQLHPDQSVQIVPAARRREWMDALPQQFANRCLPMMIANQDGWWLLNRAKFTAMWWPDREDKASVTVSDSGKDAYAVSHFGHGILTFSIPYLFRTEPGCNLVVRGPTNRPKDGIQALDGVIEADWSPSTFTMNWQFTRPLEPIVFEKDEPFCQLSVEPRGQQEQVEPEIRSIASDPEEERRYRDWEWSRARFMRGLEVPDSEAWKQGWQKDYFQGRNVPGHQTKLTLRDWKRVQ